MKPGFFLLLVLLGNGVCRAQDLVFAVSSGSAMPMTAFSGNALTGGLLKDFGDALSGALHMTPRYLVMPRKRVEEALRSGRVDILCDLRPEWLDARDYAWSATIFTNHMIVATRMDTPPARTLQQLRGARLGTIHGYRYAEIEAAVGGDFRRDDATTDDTNLAKLLLHRFDYLVTNSLHFDYARAVHPARQHLNPHRLHIMSFDTYCAIKPPGKLTLERLNRAIDTLHKRGAVERMLARYRAPAK